MKTICFMCYLEGCAAWKICGGHFGEEGKKLIEENKKEKIYACKHFIPIERRIAA